MEKRLSFAAGNKRRNGFFLMEILLAVMLAALLIAVLLPSAVAVVRLHRSGAVLEELTRQGTLLDEAMFVDLRYGKQIEVSQDYIKFISVKGLHSGYIVRGRMVYRILDNGTSQPMTNLKGVGMPMDIGVYPYEERPYFSRAGACIHIAMRLCDSRSGRSWPCLIAVVPVYEEEDVKWSGEMES